MRVEVHAADRGGCGHYRMIWPGRAVAESGMADVVVRGDGGDGGDEPTIQCLVRDVDGVPRVDSVLDPPDADVVVLQRPLKAATADLVVALQAKGIAVVVELDDDFTAIHPNNQVWADVQPKSNPGRNFKHLLRACANADWVTVSTTALARRYAPHGRVSVIPNRVPDWWMTLPVSEEEHELPWIGWSGTLATHPTDLQQVGSSVARLVNAGAADFAVVGSGVGIERVLGLAEPPLTTGWLDLDEYPVGMGRIDIGIVPLDLTPFNEAKSWLKGLEFAARGVPFVASPTGPYLDLAALGIGQIARRPKEWTGMLKALLDPCQRGYLGAKYREAVVEKGLVMSHGVHEWVSAWSSALRNRRVARDLGRAADVRRGG